MLMLYKIKISLLRKINSFADLNDALMIVDL